MSSLSRRVTKAYRMLRDFHTEVATMLGAADAIFAEHGWSDKAGSRCQSDKSSSLHSPLYWLPRDMFRFYEKKATPNRLAFLSLLVDECDGEAELDQSLLSAGILDYGDKNKEGNEYEYWYARWHLYVDDRTDDGKLCTGGYEDAPARIKRAVTLALPLDEITGSDALKSRVVVPLLESLSDKGKAG